MLRGAKPVADCSVTLPLTTVEAPVKVTSSSCLPELEDLADTDSKSSSDDPTTEEGVPELTVQIVQAKSGYASRC